MPPLIICTPYYVPVSAWPNGYVTNYINNPSVFLSARNSSSYSGSGQTWADLSSNHDDYWLGTTTSADANDPTYNSTGYFTLNDPSNSKLFQAKAVGGIFSKIGASDVPFTFESLVRLSSTSTSNNIMIVNNAVSASDNGFKVAVQNGKFMLTAYPNYGATQVPSNYSPLTNSWYHIAYAGQFNGTTTGYCFINGILESSSTFGSNSFKSSAYASNYPLIGGYINPTTGASLSNNWTGDISLVRAYNSILTQSQLQQNYQDAMNSMGWNNIATNGLQLHLDATNRSSYDGVSTTTNSWVDLTGNNYNGSAFQSVGPMNFDKAGWMTPAVAPSSNAGGYVDINSPAGSFVRKVGATQVNATLEFWYYNNGVGSGGYAELLCNCGSGGNGLRFYHNGSNQVAMMVQPSGQVAGFNNTIQNGWNHLALQVNVDGTGSVLYINGVPSTATAISNTGFTQSSDSSYLMRLGSIYTYSNEWPLGAKISVFRAYNRLLSASEISQNFNAQRWFFGI